MYVRVYVCVYLRVFQYVLCIHMNKKRCPLAKIQDEIINYDYVLYFIPFTLRSSLRC